MNAETPSPTNRQTNEIGQSIKRRRLLMHRIVVKANDLNDNPIGRQVAESQCPCHQEKPLKITLEELAHHTTAEIHNVRPQLVAELAAKIECTLKAIINDPYQPIEYDPPAKRALRDARCLLDTAMEIQKCTTVEQRAVNRKIHQKRKVEDGLAKIINTP